MTGQLRNLTGSAMTADHERRIRDLERRLSAKQTNLPRRAVTSNVAHAVFAGISSQLGGVIPDGANRIIDAWTEVLNNIGAYLDTPTSTQVRLPAGYYEGWVTCAWASDPDGGRGLYPAIYDAAGNSLPWTNGWVEMPSSSATPLCRFSSAPMISEVEEGGGFGVNVQNISSGAALSCQVALRIVRLA